MKFRHRKAGINDIEKNPFASSFGAVDKEMSSPRDVDSDSER